VKSTPNIGKLFASAELMHKAIDGMANAAEWGGDTRALTIILNMRAALDAGDIELLKRWMRVLEQHAKRSKKQ
jgi:hypothetical protein